MKRFRRSKKRKTQKPASGRRSGGEPLDPEEIEGMRVAGRFAAELLDLVRLDLVRNRVRQTHEGDLAHLLVEHATERRFVHRHVRQTGDLVIWDNRCTLHRGRRYDDIKHKRDLRRVTTQDLTTAQNNPELAAAM